MPELPDVEIFRRYVDAHALFQPIEEVRVINRTVLHRISPRRLMKTLKGSMIVGTHRHGKVLFARLEDHGGYLVLRFGMTGFVSYGKDGGDLPHVRVLLQFSHGAALAYHSQRMLGEVEVTETIDDYLEDRNLGPDAWRIGQQEFHTLLDGKRGAIKNALMDQRFLAGLGNVYCDEILFQARLHPRIRIEDLSRQAIDRLYRSVNRVLETAIRCQADPVRMPRTWLTPHRGRDGARCPRCRSRFQRLSICARTAYVCPTCQGMDGRLHSGRK